MTPKVGRPSKYSVALAERICTLLREGNSERQIAAMEGMPSAATLGRWKSEHSEFQRDAIRAREASADFYDDRRRARADELYETARRALAGEVEIPRGYIEAMKIAMQEDARSAALRNAYRYGDRKRVEPGADESNQSSRRLNDSLGLDL